MHVVLLSREPSSSALAPPAMRAVDVANPPSFRPKSFELCRAHRTAACLKHAGGIDFSTVKWRNSTTDIAMKVVFLLSAYSASIAMSRYRALRVYLTGWLICRASGDTKGKLLRW